MRKKIFYISAFLIFVLLLSGCTAGKPTVPEMATDEELIRGVIKDYYSAKSKQKWDLAQSYCVDGSWAYEWTGGRELYVNDLLSSGCNSVTLNYSSIIKDIDIVGDEAQAYSYLTLVVKCDGKELSFPHSGDSNVIILLQKIGNSWKIWDWIIDY
jgi:hypothetical protein